MRFGHVIHAPASPPRNLSPTTFLSQILDTSRWPAGLGTGAAGHSGSAIPASGLSIFILVKNTSKDWLWRAI
ncbi:hypothetical protein PanWU01x14_220850 [Parasponia andersonii]|uniref:Uncharacterized protein n=1 Tax=Parasponia andersonii TaxID=3476 RepID=A0A2P5BPY4_PARAD|nr:hypothetical protein PanWU01x14_220850 [Parasponia andersonii]